VWAWVRKLRGRLVSEFPPAMHLASAAAKPSLVQVGSKWGPPWQAASGMHVIPQAGSAHECRHLHTYAFVCAPVWQVAASGAVRALKQHVALHLLAIPKGPLGPHSISGPNLGMVLNKWWVVLGTRGGLGASRVLVLVAARPLALVAAWLHCTTGPHPGRVLSMLGGGGQGLISANIHALAPSKVCQG